MPRVPLSGMMTEPAKAAWLLAESGLCSNQLARAADVSERTFRSWAGGVPVPETHRARLNSLHELVAALPEDTPEARRRAFLSGATGSSLFHVFLQTRHRPALIHPSLTGRQQLGL